MTKFRKKPVVIDAIQIPAVINGETDPNFGDKLEAFMTGADWTCVDGYLAIVTLEGTMRADLGDWIIKGVKGEVYPCKPDIFAATYEPASEPASVIP